MLTVIEAGKDVANSKYVFALSCGRAQAHILCRLLDFGCHREQHLSNQRSCDPIQRLNDQVTLLADYTGKGRSLAQDTAIVVPSRVISCRAVESGEVSMSPTLSALERTCVRLSLPRSGAVSRKHLVH